ncbi:Alpha/Beta hydrolase protein [Leptodontidium sp. MPI-SDFR-AT-0119]|nr:Alpha/Beta hydrolase protein [Leptodontidium sp. MPI-SDFR-AT-0119]
MASSFPGALESRPFEVHVAEEAITEFKQLLQLSKLGPATFENTTSAGPGVGLSRDWTENTREYWLSKYDWRKTEARINSFDNFKATVQGEDGVGYDIHFLALRSKKKGAVPVVLLHGWPGSPLEFLSFLELAQSKYKPEGLPYTFIVPSLPGYGFSSGPSLQREWTLESTAYIIDKLLVGLGFETGYIAQGGDIGSFVARILAARRNTVNFALMMPPEGVDPADINEAELKGLERAGAFGAQGDAYAREHGQRPATIGLLLSTSPLALLIWIAEKFLDWVDEPLSLDKILDSVSFYWYTETFPRSIYPYRQFFGPSPESMPLKYYVEKPMGYSWFPKEIAPIPKIWVKTTGNLVWHKQHEAGGHFAALERPQDLFQDVEEFVAAVWK